MELVTKNSAKREAQEGRGVRLFGSASLVAASSDFPPSSRYFHEGKTLRFPRRSVDDALLLEIASSLFRFSL